MFDRTELARFPTDPGVYLMKDKKGRILYVGKAKNIRSRVKQYFSKGGDSRPQIPFLLRRVETIETIIVTSEKEALLLEDGLIKKHQPQYNLFLKDDKAFISLKLTRHRWPMLKVVRHRGRAKKGEQLFGPYTSSHSARQTLDLLQRLFPLRRCSDRELASRSRPCILHQIHRCVAPCAGMCTKEEYDLLVSKATNFLSGKDEELLLELKEEMKAASAALEFERAGELLQTIRHIEKTVEKQKVHQAGGGDLDLVALYREGAEVTLAQMIYREGQLIGAENFHFSGLVQEDEDLMRTFLLQHYGSKEELPEQILLGTELPTASLIEEILPGRCQIRTPKRGDKRELVEMAERNAAAAFEREKDRSAVAEESLLAMEEQFDLVSYPHRIDCFDTSNLQGSEPVAAMVVFIEGEKSSSFYRKYKIRSAKAGDDYAAMEEVLRRRLERGKREDDLPDCLLIDGGKGHLGVAQKVLEELNIITVDLIALAKEKGRHDKGITAERVYLIDRDEPIDLPTHSPILFLLQRIRDEAHRVAITFHRGRRKKRVLRSALDDIPGIGPVKKSRLLKEFGSPKRIFAATPDELLKVPGITQKDVDQLITKK